MRFVTAGIALGLFASAVWADTKPNVFTFIDRTGVPLNQPVTSAAVKITGIDAPAPVSVTGGSYSIGCGGDASYVTSAGTVINNDTVCVRHNSAQNPNVALSTKLLVGGIGDSFTSVTASPTAGSSSLMPYVSGSGLVKLLDAAKGGSASNPVTVNIGLSADNTTTPVTLLSATISGTTASNVRSGRLAYVKGKQVFVHKLPVGGNAGFVRASSIANACRINEHHTDFADINNSWLGVRRAGADTTCNNTDDSLTAIKVSATSSNAGVSPTGLKAFHAINNSSSGAIVGFLTVEGSPLKLVHRDANFGTPVDMMNLADATFGVRHRYTGRVFLALKPAGQSSVKLFSYDGAANGTSVSSELYVFTTGPSPFGGSVLDGSFDANNFYFADGDKLLRLAQSAATTGQAQVITTFAARRINGVVLPGFSHDRLVFQALNLSTGAAGLYSVLKTASNLTSSTALQTFNLFGTTFAYPVLTTPTGVYINLSDSSTDSSSAVRVQTNGTGKTTTANAYWAGGGFNTTVDFSTGEIGSAAAYGLMATINGSTHTLQLVDLATGAAGITLGAVSNAAPGESLTGFGAGRYLALTASVVRNTVTDTDAYFADSQTASSLRVVLNTTKNDFTAGF